MANDFECTRCGYREGAHDCPPEDYPGICNSYRRSRAEYNFDRAAEKAKREADRKTIRPSDAVWLMTPFGPIDIGS